MIKVNNVSLKYSGFQIKNLSFEIARGEIVAVTGNNASGKTTLIKLIAGLLKPKQGQILINGTVKHQQRIGLVLQNPDNQIIYNKVYDDIEFTLKNYHIPKEEFAPRITKALEMVGMVDYIHSETFSLSTGQKQRVVIANMLAIKPDIIIFDEASAYLDSSSKQVLYNIFNQLKAQGVTVIFTTNLIEEIVYADKVAIMEKGNLVAYKSRTEILSNLSEYRQLGIYIPLKLKLLEQLKMDCQDDDMLLQQLAEQLKW